LPLPVVVDVDAPPPPLAPAARLPPGPKPRRTTTCSPADRPVLISIIPLEVVPVVTVRSLVFVVEPSVLTRTVVVPSVAVVRLYVTRSTPTPAPAPRRATRSHTFPAPTDNTATILAAAQTVLVSVRPLIAEAGLTLIGITLANLDHADAIQLELPFRTALLADLDHAMDRIRDRFGTAALTRAALVGRDSGLTVPLLPD